MRVSSVATFPSRRRLWTNAFFSAVATRTPMSCCFSGDTLTVPAGSEANSEPEAMPSMVSAYTGSMSIPQGAFPGLSEVCAGFIGST